MIKKSDDNRWFGCNCDRAHSATTPKLFFNALLLGVLCCYGVILVSFFLEERPSDERYELMKALTVLWLLAVSQIITGLLFERRASQLFHEEERSPRGR